MIRIEGEQEHYCLVTDGGWWTVIERRAGKYYPLGNCARSGLTLDQPEAALLFDDGRRYPEPAARRMLAEVAGAWRDLAEHIR